MKKRYKTGTLTTSNLPIRVFDRKEQTRQLAQILEEAFVSCRKRV